MTQKTRVWVAIGVVIAMVAVVFGVDWIRGRSGSMSGAVDEGALAPGSVPIYLDGRLIGGFQPADLERLEEVSFKEPAEGQKQEGWLLRDVLLLYVDAANWKPDHRITVSSSGRGKSAQVTWAEADDASNWVMFDLSNRGTLKLVSVLEKLSTRDQWVQDVDKIEVER